MWKSYEVKCVQHLLSIMQSIFCLLFKNCLLFERDTLWRIIQKKKNLSVKIIVQVCIKLEKTKPRIKPQVKWTRKCLIREICVGFWNFFCLVYWFLVYTHNGECTHNTCTSVDSQNGTLWMQVKINCCRNTYINSQVNSAVHKLNPPTRSFQH